MKRTFAFFFAFSAMFRVEENVQAQVIITEVAIKDSPVWAEIYNAGSSPVDISAYSLWDVDGSFSAFASETTTLLAGAHAVIHWASGTDETDGIGDNGNGYIDLYVPPDECPDGSNDQLALTNGSNWIDAVCWSNGTLSSDDLSDVAFLFSLGVWTDISPDGAGVEDCFTNSDDIGTTASLARFLDAGSQVYADNDSKGDWYEASSHTPGGLNGQTVAIELTSFRAIAGDGHIILEWITESEMTNLGFEILRSLEEKNNYQKLPIFIKGAGTSAVRHEYQYIDRPLKNGVAYFYKLVEVDFSGNKIEHGPVFAKPHLERYPTSFNLAQNYPNPFNSETLIKFDIAFADNRRKLASTKLTIYDLLGRPLVTLVDGNLEPGTYKIYWGGKDKKGNTIPAGIYFCRLQIENRIVIRKMLLLR